jgi:Uncharacterized protein conserved in bacteria (DUF2252)
MSFLKGQDGLLMDNNEDGQAIILDVKYQPPGAVTRVIQKEEVAAWYKVVFPNEASRVVEAQRRLTSYTDPYTGWVMMRVWDKQNKTYRDEQPFNVRQRSPWKASPDLDALTDPDDFYDFVAQIAIATATSHVRGTATKPPGDFKDVIAVILGGSFRKRREWGDAVARVSVAYREQVLKDFECFRNYVMEQYGSSSS